MKRARFIGVISSGGMLPSDAKERLNREIETIDGFANIWSGLRATLWSQPPSYGFGHGAIVGSIFRRGTEGPIARFSPAEDDLIAVGAGQYLIDAHWGGYVALIERTHDVVLVRAPLGDLPCFFTPYERGTLIASDMTLIERVTSRRTAIDYDALARQFAAPDLRRSETCLAGISELQGGRRLVLTDRSQRIETGWSPWTFAERGRQIASRDDARRRVRDAVCHAVTASCRPHGKVVLRLSGGLDSSIVAAALNTSAIPTVALNLVTEDPAGDERHYARLVAQSLGLDMAERLRRIDSVDLATSAARNLPRPTARAFVQSALRHAVHLAAETGSGAIVDGGGGDNVFCSLQSIRPVIDCLAAGSGWHQAADTARSIATLAQVSQWAVLRRAVVGRAQRLSKYGFPLDCRLLSRAAAASADGAADHLWLEAPPGALPGKAAHVGLVAAAQSVVEGFDPLDPIPLVSPLISQPVIETCLSIPSWWWFDQGHNRAVAREAFADLLPRTIVERRSKGGSDGFIALLYRHHRSSIGEMLMDGLLMRNGLLDRAAVTKTLSEQGPVQNHDFLRIMQLVDAEIWARSRVG